MHRQVFLKRLEEALGSAYQSKSSIRPQEFDNGRSWPIFRQHISLEIASRRVRIEIVYTKGIHNTVADSISRLEYDPAANPDRLSYHMRRVQSRVENDNGIC